MQRTCGPLKYHSALGSAVAAVGSRRNSRRNRRRNNLGAGVTAARLNWSVPLLLALSSRTLLTTRIPATRPQVRGGHF